jgi:hypothetical protein
MATAARMSTGARTLSCVGLLSLSFACSSAASSSLPGAGASGVAGTSPAGAGGSAGASTTAVGGVGPTETGQGGSIASGGGLAAGGATAIAGAGGAGSSSGAAGAAGAGGAQTSPRELIVYDDSNGRLLYLNSATPSLNWASSSGAGRDVQLVGNGRVMLGKADGWDEYRVSDGVKVSGQHGFPGTDDTCRLADGNTLLASVSGTSILLKMVDGSGQAQTTITYPGFSYVRMVRPTATGTYMVTADTIVFEGNAQGKILWQVTPAGGKHVWKAMRLANGNTAISTGYGATLVIYDSAGKLVQTIGGAAQPNAAQIAPWFYTDFQVMPNGGFFVVNSQADRTMDNSVQLLEYDASGALIWQQKQPIGVRTLEEGIVIDGLDTTKLYVEPQGQLVAAP